MKTKDANIERAIQIAGGQAALAERAGISQTAVHKYLYGKVRPKAETAIAIERATDGVVSRKTLRPDIAWDH